MSMVLGVPKQGQSIYGAMGGIVKVDDSAKYLANYGESIKALGEITSAAKIPMLGRYSSKMIEIDGSPALEIVMDYSEMIAMYSGQLGAAQPATGAAMKAYMEMMLGKDGKMAVYVQPVDKTTVAIAWAEKGSLNRLKAAIKSPTEGLAANAEAKQTAALLPKGSQWMVLLSPSGVVSVVKTAVQVFGMPGDRLPDLGDVPPLGAGARLESGGAEFELVVPGKTLEGISKQLHGQ